MPKKNLLWGCEVVVKLIFGLVLSQPVFATEYLSPRELGLGGAGRAAPIMNDAIYLNPSYASFLPSYNLEGGYTWFNGGRVYNASIQDSRTELFQAGVGYTVRPQNAAINFGASKQAVDRLGFGIGGKLILDNDTHNMTTDFLVSTSFIATDWFLTSLIIDNLLQTTAAVDRNLYRTIYLATKFRVLEVIQIYFDPFIAPSYSAGDNLGYAVGVELSLLADFYLRLGQYLHSDVPYLNTHGSGYGLGIGWVGPRIAVGYGFHHVSANDAGIGIVNAHAIDLTVYF